MEFSYMVFLSVDEVTLGLTLF